MKRTLMMLSAVMLASAPVGFALENQSVTPAQAEAPRARRADTAGRGFLGVELDEVDAESARRLGLRQERGALITSVVENSGAASAGLKIDDVVIKWDGETVESAAELSRLLRETPAGRNVKLTIIRGGREMDVDAKLGSRVAFVRPALPARPQVARTPRAEITPRIEITPRPARPARPARMWRVSRARLGVQLGEMNEQLAEYFGVKGKGGALVLFVHADSPAAKAGVKAGDVITSVAGKSIDGAFDIHEAINDKEEGPVEVKVVRDRQERTITLQLEKDGTTSWVLDSESFDPHAVITPMIVPTFRWENFAPVIRMPEIKMAPLKMPKIVIPTIKMPVWRIRNRAV